MTDEMMTINISMPKALYKQAQKAQKKFHYVSVSEIMRDALRWWMSDNLTRNGFTDAFERGVLRAEKQADAGKVVEWDGKTPFSEFVLSHPYKNHAKNRVHTKVSKKVQKDRVGETRFAGISGSEDFAV